MATPPADPSRMTLIEHLLELRTRIVRSVGAILLGGIVAWFLYPWILDFLLHPYCNSLSEEAKAQAQSVVGGSGCRLLNTDPLGGLSLRLTMSVYCGIAIAVPVILWQLWRFVAPGLYKHERRWVWPFVIAGAALFALGAGLAFWTIPKALTWLADVGGSDLVTVFSPKPYLSFIIKMMLAFGLGFEFPIILCFLQMIGAVTPQQLSKWRRYSIVGITTIVAVITPSGDPFTLIVLTIPMLLFYELSIVYGRLWQRSRRKRAEKAAAEAGAPA
jgi:sec-independent protein translocase protein TatC